jgi:hypothetical protein
MKVRLNCALSVECFQNISSYLVLFCIEESRPLQSDLANLRITTDLDITLTELTELERRRNVTTSSSSETSTTQRSPTHSPQVSVSNNIKTPQPITAVGRKVTLANKLSIEGRPKKSTHNGTILLFQIALIVKNVFDLLSSGGLLARREVVAKEIFDTEENYVRSLEEIIKVRCIYLLNLNFSLSLSLFLKILIDYYFCCFRFI